MKIRILGKILITLMLAACSTQQETTNTTSHHTAVTMTTPSSQVSAPPLSVSQPSISMIGGAH